MRKSVIILLIVSSLFVCAMIAGCTQTTTPKSTVATPTVATPAESSAKVQLPPPGPLVGDWNIASQEAACAAAVKNPPWYPTLLSYEAVDMGRSHCYSCAQFTGSFTGPNTVFAYQSRDKYYSGSMMTTRGISDLYVYGGASGANPTPYGSYVSKIEPGTLNELWRTTVDNINTTGHWMGAGSIEALDGDVLLVSGSRLYKIDGDTGAVKQFLDLPTGKSAPNDVYFNGMDSWPDGALVMKCLTRPPGCTVQGFDAVLPAYCPGTKPPAAIDVVDSKTLTVLDSIDAEEFIGGRITTSVYNGKNYAYMIGATKIYRYVWDGHHITLDKTWGPVDYLKPGQTAGSASSIMGDWVITQTNGGGATTTPLSVVSINQGDSSKINRIDPIPLKPGQNSYIPSMQATDVENNRLYAMDPGANKVVGLDFDQVTGKMTLAWSVDQATWSWMTLIGPANQRVLVASNIVSSEPDVAKWNIGPVGANFKEQLMWRDASTGKLLAAGEFYGPQVIGMKVWPGYGGLIYEILTDGTIVEYQVLPKAG
jgi:hypothetical protein